MFSGSGCKEVTVRLSLGRNVFSNMVLLKADCYIVFSLFFFPPGMR